MKTESKIASFLKRLENCRGGKPKADYKRKNDQLGKSMGISQSVATFEKRSPSVKTLLALGILNDTADNQKSSRQASRKLKKAVASREINRHNSNKVIETYHSNSRTTPKRQNIEEGFHKRIGSQTERSMNVVNNFNVKITEENLSEKLNYEIADLKLNLQLKSFELTTLTQTAKNLKKTNRKLEQDNLQLKQEVDELGEKFTKVNQEREYYKSLSQLKSEELVSLNTKFSQMKKQIGSLSTEDLSRKSLSNWGSNLITTISEAKPESPRTGSLKSSILSGDPMSQTNRDQLKKLLIEIEATGKVFTGEAISFLSAFIENEDVEQSGSVPACKMAILMNTMREAFKEDSVTRKEMHKTTASIHQHYVTRMNLRQQEFLSELASKDQALANLRSILSKFQGSQSVLGLIGSGEGKPLDTLQEVDEEGEGQDNHDDGRILASFVEPADLERLQNHDFAGLSLIYKQAN